MKFFVHIFLFLIFVSSQFPKGNYSAKGHLGIFNFGSYCYNALIPDVSIASRLDCYKIWGLFSCQILNRKLFQVVPNVFGANIIIWVNGEMGGYCLKKIFVASPIAAHPQLVKTGWLVQPASWKSAKNDYEQLHLQFFFFFFANVQA